MTVGLGNLESKEECDISMARTKQAARKSTGGKAPRNVKSVHECFQGCPARVGEVEEELLRGHIALGRHGGALGDP